MTRVFNCLICTSNQTRPCHVWLAQGKPDAILNCASFRALDLSNPVRPRSDAMAPPRKSFGKGSRA